MALDAALSADLATLPPEAIDRVRDYVNYVKWTVKQNTADRTGNYRASRDVALSTSPVTGLPVISLGRPITSEEVYAFLDEDA